MISEPKNLYKNINNTDVAIEVLEKSLRPDEGHFEIRVKWWNIGPHDPYPISIGNLPIEQIIEIKIDDWLDKWIQIYPFKLLVQEPLKY